MYSWFAFRAWNSETLYGFGTSEEAEKYADLLNEGKDKNLYSAYELTPSEGENMHLEGRSDTFSIDEALAEHEWINS